MPALLEIKNVVKNYDGKTPVLEGVSLELNKGEVIVLIGPSGCGKSTLLRCINGLEAIQAGEICLEGKAIDYNKKDLTGLRQKIGMVFQSYELFPHMTILDNIILAPTKVAGVDKENAKREAMELLEKVGLAHKAKAYPRELSGGQKQRVAIARAVVNKPSVLLLDEPLGALDLMLRRQMQTELKKLQKALGITFIYITHDQEEALNMSSRIVVMRNGKIEQTGTPSEVYDTPKTAFVAEFVGGANLYKEGEKIFAIRSEHVRLGVGDYAGVVTENSFMAGLSKVKVRLRDGQEITSSHMGMNIDLNIGDEISVGWDKNDMVEVEGEK